MNKRQFLRKLKKCLRGMSREGIADSLQFYDEAIAERIERGEDEKAAVAAMGSPEEAAGRILEELPTEAILQIRSRRRFMRTIGWPALIIGFPVWLSLIAAAAAVVISVAVAYWAVVLAFFASAAALIVCVVPCAALIFVSGSMANGVACVSAALACAGLGILFMIGGILLLKAGIICFKKIFGKRR